MGFYDVWQGADCGRDRPFLWQDGVFTALPEPSWEHNSVSAAGINARGDVVGQWLDNEAQTNYGYFWPTGGGPVSFGFSLGSGFAKVTSPASINARGDSVGFSYVDTDPADIPPGAFFGPCRGFFRDREGVITELKIPGASYTCSLGLNAAGEISGIYTTDSPTSLEGFLEVKWHGFIAQKSALTLAR